MKTLSSFNFTDKRALIRVDFNVPLDADLRVTDASRIEAAKPTIIHILENGGSVVLMSHLGRPDGKPSDAFSLKHLVEKIEEVIGVSVQFSPDTIGAEAEKRAEELEPGQILLLENLRFFNEETDGDEGFAASLARLGHIYVNDAFGTAHRAHASTAIIAKFFPENKCFGLLMEKEILAIEQVLKTGEHPITAIMGGSKVSSKITIIENVLPAIDHLIVGGGMTYTFVKALGGSVGDSICENDKLDLALSILEKAKQHNVTVHLPVDVIAANDFAENADTKVVDANAIESGWQGLDAGPKTLEIFEKVILASKTILWNGPVGVFEMEAFAGGTKAIGRFVQAATEKGAFSLVGGGDSVSAVKQFGFSDKVSYVSTGGGAMLESLEGKTLPGVAAILEG
ncbi:MAG: phosphoglycerate kinase [Bacteroidetes bacterium]|jgi:phosphoglycerate kinase|nr:phosphoglycerate kinase [Bacteroidota bacterium]